MAKIQLNGKKVSIKQKLLQIDISWQQKLERQPTSLLLRMRCMCPKDIDSSSNRIT